MPWSPLISLIGPTGATGSLPAATVSGQYLVYDGASWIAGSNEVRIGANAGSDGQGSSAVAVGLNAGLSTQGSNAVAVGLNAGSNTQGYDAIAIGCNAGNSGQSLASIAIGVQAACNSQGSYAVAIGDSAGSDGQGAYAVAIGHKAGSNSQSSNSIILSASSEALNATNPGFYVAPVRNLSSANVVMYDPATAEFTYDTTALYTTASAGWWDTEAPVTVADAIDRLANFLYTICGVIPVYP